MPSKKPTPKFQEENLDDLLKITEEDLSSAPVPEEDDFEEDEEAALVARLEALRASKYGTASESEEEKKVAPSEEKEYITIHFLEDGHTALGFVWYRGQELTFEVGSEAHKSTFDRNGNSWLDLADNPREQVLRYGGQKFARGPWPFLPWGVAVDADDQTKKDAEEAAKAEARRNKIAVITPIR